MKRSDIERKADEAVEREPWFTFILDAWEGSGGFAPIGDAQVRYTSGAQPSARASAKSPSYLTKHERESEKEFAARVQIARHPNNMRRALSHFLGLLFRQAPEREGLTYDREDVRAWLNDCDGCGTPWDEFLRQWALRALLYAGAPVLVDRPDDAGALTAADAEGPAYVRHVYPQCLFDWQRDDFGRFAWVKIVEQRDECDGPFAARVVYQRATCWSTDELAIYRLDDGKDYADVVIEPRANLLGEVPLEVLAYEDAVGPALFGWSPATPLGALAREEFADVSRLVELHEKQTFAQLTVPEREGSEGQVKELKIGPATAFGYPQGASAPSYIAPPDGPVLAHERKLDRDRAESLQALGLEMLLSSSQAPTSGLARQYEFQHLNAGLGRFAQRLAAAERRVLYLVLRHSGESEDQARAAINDYKVTWPADFDVRDRQTDVALAGQILDLPGIDPVMRNAVIRMVRTSCLPSMSSDDVEASDALLEEIAKAQLMTLEPGADEDGVAVAVDEPDGDVANPMDAVALAPTDMASVITVNEARAMAGLGPLKKVDGSLDPNGGLTVAEFRAKREAAGSVVGDEVGKVEAEDETGEPVSEPAPAMPFGAPPSTDDDEEQQDGPQGPGDDAEDVPPEDDDEGAE